MKRTLATAGLQAHADAPRLHAGCGVTGYAWPADTAIHQANPVFMAVFATSKPARRLKEPSP
jgi:hypothetical protein